MSAITMNGGGKRLVFLVFSCRQNGLSLVRLAHTKTPVQELGWQYIKHQQSLGRPLSPHLSIYKPQLTSMVSIAHRISGCIMSGTLFFGVLFFVFGPFKYSNFIERVRSWQLPWPITASAKFIIAWTIAFHSINGIRFLGFELARGIALEQIYRSGYLVLALSTLVALLVVANSKRMSTAEVAAAEK